MKKIILLGLNELNFDYIQYYINKEKLENFKFLFEKYGYSETTSESEYKLLEPWIQWVTVTTGKTFDEHKVFRLGDMVDRKDLKQIFEIAEEKGLRVGGISPFNVDNRLKKPAFFVPDPWTKTKASGSWLLKKLSIAVSQTVNNNAEGKVSKISLFYIFISLFTFVKLNQIPGYISIFRNIKNKGSKAVILDKLLGNVFLNQWRKFQPDFSNLFLNTGAHFQHHYMFNSAAYDGELENPDWYCPRSQDPLLMILKEYDKVIGGLLKLDVRLIIATGLHQKPHKHNTFYWRLKKHDQFVKENLGLSKYKKIIPRMSRDFLVEFENDIDARSFQETIESIYSQKDNIPVFTVDNRGDSLFIELTYSCEINDGMTVTNGNGIVINNFEDKVAFVAIKNGEHDGIGYLIDTNVKLSGEKEEIELKEVFNILKESLNS